MHLANLFRHNRVNILLRGQTDVELTSGHEVEGEPVAEGGEEPRAQVVWREKTHRRRFVTLKNPEIIEWNGEENLRHVYIFCLLHTLSAP